MRNEQAVVIKRAFQAIGAGLLEVALEREGRKGCSPVLCCEPVALEPMYERFDSGLVLGRPSRLPEVVPAGVVLWSTWEVFAAEEDVLSLSWMETVLRALVVLPGPFAFELVGRDGRVHVRFGVPEGQVPGFRAALLGHFPKLVVRRVEDGFPSGVPVVEELVPVAPYHRSLSLLGAEGASPLSLAAVVLSGMPRGTTGVFQVLLAPSGASHDWHYNVENLAEAEVRATSLAQLGGLSSQFAYDRELPPLWEPGVREKVRLDVGFFAVVARYGCWGAGVEETRAFLQGMRVATGMVRFGNRAWRVLEHDALVASLGEDGVRGMVAGRTAHRSGLMVTSREVATLVHVPNARALAVLSCFEQRRGFEWQPYLEEGVACLGVNEYAGAVERVELPLDVRLRHAYVVGATGSGKSKLVERLAVDDVVAGRGLCVVDPHGDLCLDVLSRVPEERLGEVVWVSFGEEGLVPRWNPFVSGAGGGKLADDVARAFMAQAGTAGARMEHNFRMLAYVVHSLGGTLDDFAELAARSARGDALRDEALARCGNPQVVRFLRSELPGYARGDLSSVTNKLSRLLLDDQLGVMFRERENTLEPRRWMDEGRIVLVNLASGTIGADHARFVGSLLVSLIYRAAVSRADRSPDHRRAFFLYLDEFQQLQSATLGEILGEGRKYGLGAVLAHQERGQLGAELAQALGNCATKVVFRPSEADLPYLHRVLGSSFDPDTLRGLGIGQAVLVSGSKTASLTTELCPYPILRDPRAAARRYAQAHYLPVGGPEAPRARRPRVYDTLGLHGDG